jgi:hypothetical protein
MARELGEQQAVQKYKELIILKKDALEKGLKHYFTGIPCKAGHVCNRYTSNNSCVDCLQLRNEMPETKKRTEKWRNRNKKKLSEYFKEKRKDSDWVGKQRVKSRKYYKENKQTMLANMKQHYLENREMYAAYSSRAKKRIKIATPKWVVAKDLQQIYAVRNKVNQSTGTEHHVDHYYPIKGKTICGLNVPWNLQIITAEENLAKGNKMPEDFYGANHTMIPALTCTMSQS